MTTNEIFYKYQDHELIKAIREYENLSAMWEAAAEQYADLPAIVDEGKHYTYSDLNTDIGKFRTVLRQKGLGYRDTVCIMADKSYDFIKALLSCVTMGITAAVFPLHFGSEEIGKFYDKFGAKCILFDDAYSGAVGSFDAGQKVNISETSSELTYTFLAYPKEMPCLIMFTGGTLGNSKGAVLSHECVMQGIMNGCYGYNAVFRQRYMLALPLYHVLGLIRSVLTPLYTGSEIFINHAAQNLFRDIAVYHPTIIVIVPMLVERGLALSKETGRNLFGTEMKYIITGAAPLAPYIAKACAGYGMTLCMGYGLTETACLVSGNPDMLSKPGSVGPLYPNQEVKIVEDELWLKGRNLLTRYIDEEENARSFQDGWFRTGDAVRFDEDGFLYIIGRKKEMLLTENGENVYPSVVEERFNALEWVQASQLFLAENEEGRRCLALEVFPRTAPGSGDFTREQMLAELKKVNEALPKFQRAESIALREKDFDRTSSLKMIRYPNTI